MKRKKYISGILFSVIMMMLFISCTRSSMTEDELIKYIQNPSNGLLKTHEAGDYRVEVQLRPTDLILSKNYKKEVEQGKADSLRQELSKYLYFSMHLSCNDTDIENNFVSNPDVFQRVISYLSYDMSGDITLISEDLENPVDVADYIFARMYGTMGYSSVLFAFDKDKLEDADEFEIHFHDRKMGSGIHSFPFDMKDINHLPEITFKN